MRVYTYYEYPGREILGAWLSSWKCQNWEPFILSINDTYHYHKLHDRFMEKVATYPTVNDRSYELLCYRRWLAFLYTAETNEKGTFFSDYDTLNNNLPPLIPPEVTTFYGEGLGFFYLVKKDVNKVFDLLLNAPITPPHMSDMTILADFPGSERKNLVLNIPHETLLIHFHGNTKKFFGP